MNKEYLESLEKIKQEFGCDPAYYGLGEAFEIVETALHRLEIIDNSNPSEALECLERLATHRIEYREGFELCFTKTMPFKSTMEYKIIKQALLKAQKEHKALEIIKEKRVDMWHLTDLLEQTYEMYLAFCKSEKYEEDYILTEEEFDTLKEVLENE